MQTKKLLFETLARWRILAINQRLATTYIPGLILVLSILSLVFLSPNPALQKQFFPSMIKLHNYFLIEGMLVSFAIFTAFLSFYKKNRFFVIAPAWILCNLYLGSKALGLDDFWLQQQLPPTFTPYVSQLVIGMYFVLSQQLIQIGLGISPSASKKNNLLGLVALGMLLIALIPYPPLFNAAYAIAAPLALVLALFVCTEKIRPQFDQLKVWQVMLFSVLICGLISEVFYLAQLDPFFRSRFNAFILFFPCTGIIAFGMIDRMKELRLAQLELRSIYQNSPFSVLKIDHDGKVLQSNRAFKRLCAKLSLPIPKHWDDLFPPQDWARVNQRTLRGQYIEVQIQGLSELSSSSPLLALHANVIPSGYVLTLQDVTQYVKALNRLKVMVDNDPLTHALNQMGIEKSLQTALNDIHNQQPCFVAYLDLNHVNYVNRVHGHAAGDALLRKVSQRIKSVLKKNYDFGRIDSDDFIFLFNKTSFKDAQQLAKTITQQLNETPIKTDYREYKLNVHLGLIEAGVDMNPETALRTAQGACMDAKRRDTPLLTYKHNSQEMQDRSEELQLFERLEKGDMSSLFVEMQPLMSLQNPLGHFKIEVLLRVRRANGQRIPLHTFIPAAEENGAISIIDKWVFISSLEWMSANLDHLPKIQQVNVNLSGHSLNNNQFINELFVVLDKYKHVLHQLCVEITEGVALEDLHRTREFMTRLQSKGVRIALDDFGAGYTSFSYLRELPANSIKIDGALIKDMLSKESNIAIVRTIVELAKNLGMQCVAEWVEDVETLVILQKMGVNFAQGFIISKALSPAEVLAAKDIRALIKDPALLAYIKAHHTSASQTKTY